MASQRDKFFVSGWEREVPAEFQLDIESSEWKLWVLTRSSELSPEVLSFDRKSRRACVKLLCEFRPGL